MDEVLDLVGLTAVGGRRAGTFSLGMGRRLGIAGALLGDPEVILLDEPVNGVDSQGVVWIRELLKGLAAEGRTVLVSSQLMSEMAQTATQLVVIGRGRLLADTPVGQLVADAGAETVTVVADQPGVLRNALAGPGVEVTSSPGTERLTVRGLSAREVGRTAADRGIAVFELTTATSSLEDAFKNLTGGHAEHAGSAEVAS